MIVGSISLTQNDNPWVPLAAVLSLATDVPTQIDLVLTDDAGERRVAAVSGFATRHDRIPVLGLRPGMETEIEIVVRDQQGKVTAAPVRRFTTPALPASFPPLTVQTAAPAAMEPGVRLLSICSQAPGCFPTILDENGDVVWYLDCAASPIGDLQTIVAPLANGNLMLIVADRLLVEVDLLGNVVGSWSAANLGYGMPGTTLVDVDSFHHEIVELPPGSDADFAVLSTELRVFPDYPAHVGDPSQVVPSANVIGDEIVEFRRDGTVVRRISLFDVLDPYRVTYDSLSDFWNQHYGATTYDWSHGNALVLDPRTDSWVVSLRHQDVVLQLGRQTGELEWMMGDPARWNAPWSDKLLAPTGSPFEWQYHQHAPQLQPDGTMWIYDNGVARAIPPAPALLFQEAYSRAVQFRVDPIARTVEQLFSYGAPPGGSEPSFYSFFVSSAFAQPATGNLLVCDGGKLVGIGRIWGRVFEITTDAARRTVFECSVRADGVTNLASYFIYRAYRLPGLY